MNELVPASSKSQKRFSFMEGKFNDCSIKGQIIKQLLREDPLAPSATACVNGTLSPADPTFDRPANQTTGSGIQSPCFGAVVVNYDVYSFDLQGCAAFPTDLTITTCGPAGCAPVAATDPILHLYRNVPSGDPLTANGGLNTVFSAASPCTNVRAANANLNGGAASTSGTGNTCNQANTTDCIGACAANNSAAGFKRRLGNGRFTVVVSATGAADTGGYNLYIDAPAAGCTVTQVPPTAASAAITGRVMTPDGRGIGKVTVTVTGGNLSGPIQAKTNAFGYYTFSDLPVGENYVLSVSSKGVSFTNPSTLITLMEDISNADFTTTIEKNQR